MNNHPIAWTAPQPFWTSLRGEIAARAVLSQPQILRFASDEFMNELLSTLETDPASLSKYAVTEETWRGPGAAPDRQPSRWLERPTAQVLGLRRKALLKSRTAELTSGSTSAVAEIQDVAPPARLKLYQPAHQRHYLVSGSLICQMPGLPDREVNPARHKVSFLVRRLLPKIPVDADQPLPDAAQTSQWDEYAYVLRGKAAEWQKVAAADDEEGSARLATGEDRLSMFPAFFAQDDGHRRRLFIGSVPVGRREAYQGAAANSNPRPAPAGIETAQERAQRLGTLDPRVVMFQMQVVAPWRALVNRAMRNGPTGAGVDLDDGDTLRKLRPERVFDKKSGDYDPEQPLDPASVRPAALRAERSAMQISSWYLLLDLYLFLSKQLPAFWAEAISNTPSFALPEAQALFVALRDAALPIELTRSGSNVDITITPGTTGSFVETGGAYVAADVKDDLIAALQAIAPFQDALEAAPNPGPSGTVSAAFEIPEPTNDNTHPAAKPAGWPNFLFVFADAWFGVRQPPTPIGFAPPPGDYLSEKIEARIDSLADLLQDYLAVAPASDLGTDPLPEPTLASMLPADMREAWYVMRLVYERPDCAPFHGTVVSAATRPFQMAGFFDPDAPARPIRIGLPLDISTAGLRKFDKNAVFIMSDMLCGQVDRMKGLGLVDLVLSVLPWPFHKDSQRARQGRASGTATWRDVLAVDPDHHDLRADPADDHRQPARLHLPLAAVLHRLLPAARLQGQETPRS